MEWNQACRLDELDDGELLERNVQGTDVLLIRSGDQVFACPALCPHMEEPLAHGFCDGHVLTCAKHLWQWDVTSGAPVALAEMPLRMYRTRLRDGHVFVLLDEEQSESHGCGALSSCRAGAA